MKNVLLIYPPQTFTEKGTSEGLSPPLGLLYLKTMIPDCNVKILDLSVVENPQHRLTYVFESTDWDVVGITVLTYCLNSVRQIVKYIQNAGDPYLIGGGPHATLVPDDCLRMGFDASVVGEGELIMSDLVHTQPRGIIHGKAVKNLDELSFPNRNDLDNTTYGVFGFLKLPGLSTNIITSRGCPFRCSFCGRIEKGSVRRRSVDSVIQELIELQKQGFENIFIADDHFITNRRWVTTFCEALKRKQLRFNFFFQTRVDNFDIECAQSLREIGTQYIGFGIESIHPSILKYYNKTTQPALWQDRVKKALEYCDNAGIYSQASLIIGAPQETEEMFWESYDFVSEHGADTINANPLTYLVGSDIWRSAVDREIIQRDEYYISVVDRELCPIPPQRITEICEEVFQKNIDQRNIRQVFFKTLRHFDTFRMRLVSTGIRKFISWNLLGTNWRKHYNILKEFGYGKKFR